ncbi:MAG: DUF2760 domain-containing protein [Chlamydiales bacterium]|nr:DUF2760 domain-containing protein [Chlamydiales bacterium]
MSLWLAAKAFVKALKNPDEARQFVEKEGTPLLTGSETDLTHLRLLALLQRSGRLIDFLKEDITKFPDAQVGAAARQVHKECATLLEDVVTIRPVFQDEEGSQVRVPVGYDAESIKVIGNVKGNPPFEGILVHRGWKAHKRSLPRSVGEHHSEVICPAEIEVK